MLRALRIALAAACGVAVILLCAFWAGRLAPESWLGRQFAGGIVARAGQSPAVSADAQTQRLAQLGIGGPFTLVDQAGHTVTQASYPGKWKLIYFGYTTCPDVCPTTLQAIGTALSRLGGKADRVVPLFITVDPARDRADVLARYTRLFDPRIIGLTGSQEQITVAERAFRVYAARVDQPGTTTYLMDHTSFIYLLDPGGGLRALLDRDATAALIAARIDALVS